MNDPVPPPADPPWWKRWWGMTGLSLLVLAAALTLVTAVALNFGPGGTWIAIIGILFEIGLVVAIVRRDYWRAPTSPNLDSLLTLALLALCTVAVVGFCSFTCAVTGVK
jgi:hypothetical protein